jgi:RimJ/RimL family protein N-acetyltransferase
MVEGFNLHRIDWRCVSGNPAERGYLGILKHFEDKYDIARGVFRDNMKDRYGNYHDTIMFEMIKKD